METKRILHCANFNYIKHQGCYLHNVAYKISNGLIRNGHSVLNFPDRDIKRCFSVFGMLKQLGGKKFNELFYDYCISTNPDGILLGHADTVETSTLERIRKALPNVKILQWNVDCIDKNFVSHNLKNIRNKLSVVDYTIITTAQKDLLEQFGVKNVLFMPNPVDLSIEKGKAFEKEQNLYDLIFTAKKRSIRDLCGVTYSAEDFVARMLQNIDVKNVIVPGVLSKPVGGAEYQRLIENSSMGLCVSQVNDNYLYSSDRMAHMMGNGVLVFLDRRTGFDKIFSDDEIAFYSTEDELWQKIDFYHNNPQERMRVAKNGWQKYHKMFNEKIVAEYITDLMFGGYDENKYPWAKFI